LTVNPPEIRDEINYQFKGGTWIFENDAVSSVGKLQRPISTTHILAFDGESTPVGMITNNKIIIGLAVSIFSYAVERYPKSSCRALANKYSNYVT